MKSALAGSNFFFRTYNGFSDRRLCRIWARNSQSPSMILGTLTNSIENPVARGWRALCFVEVSSVAARHTSRSLVGEFNECRRGRLMVYPRPSPLIRQSARLRARVRLPCRVAPSTRLGAASERRWSCSSTMPQAPHRGRREAAECRDEGNSGLRASSQEGDEEDQRAVRAVRWAIRALRTGKTEDERARGCAAARVVTPAGSPAHASREKQVTDSVFAVSALSPSVLRAS